MSRSTSGFSCGQRPDPANTGTHVDANPGANPGADANTNASTRIAQLPEALRSLAAMFAAASSEAQAEVERVMWLQARARTRQSPAQQRVAELGALALMLDGPLAEHYPADAFAPVRVSSRVYDEHRPEAAPSSKRLLERYRDWPSVCRAAWGLLPDGRTRGPGKPWPSVVRGRNMPRPYSREECVGAVRACALALGREPTSNVFDAWVAQRRRKARPRNLKRAAARAASDRPLTQPRPFLRLPNSKSVYRHFVGWPDVMGAVALTDEELDAAWRWRLCVLRQPSPPTPEELQGTPAARLRTLSAGTLSALGLDEDDRQRMLKEGFLALPLGTAAALAGALGGSLDWLSGRRSEPGLDARRADERGATNQVVYVHDAAVGGASASGTARLPVANVRFDADAYKRLRAQARVSQTTVLSALDWPLGLMRGLLSGRDEPALGVVSTLASLLRCDIAALCQ